MITTERTQPVDCSVPCMCVCAQVLYVRKQCQHKQARFSVCTECGSELTTASGDP